MPEQKIWGTDECIWKGQGVEVHLLKLRPKDGKPVCCSWHRHEHKHNYFRVIEGNVVLTSEARPRRPHVVGNVKGVPGVRPLREHHRMAKGCGISVRPEEWHRFEVREPATVIEVTWVDTVPVDIERADVGHILEAK